MTSATQKKTTAVPQLKRTAAAKTRNPEALTNGAPTSIVAAERLVVKRAVRAAARRHALWTPQITPCATPGDYLCDSARYAGVLLYLVHDHDDRCPHDFCQSSCECDSWRWHAAVPGYECKHLRAVRAWREERRGRLLEAVIAPLLRQEGYVV